MVKIKRKVEKNLRELIEHIVQTDYEAGVYQADDAPVYVRVGRMKGIHIEGSGTLFPYNTFTVEVEEEIDEETVFEIMVKINKNGSIEPVCNHKIFNMEDSDSKEFHAYIDGEFKLIWRDGKMVE